MTPFVPTRSLVFCALFTLLSYYLPFSANGQTFDAGVTGFSITNIGSGWSEPVGTAFDISGTKLFVWEKGGRVYLCNWNNTTKVYTKQTTPVLNISEEVGNWRDHGMLGFTIDPNFETNGLIYVLYVVDRHHLINFGTGAYNALTDQYREATIGRVTRYKTITTANGLEADVSTRAILLGETITSGIPILHESHGIGSLHFAADGSLLISSGDAASYTANDFGSLPVTYFAQAITDGILRPNENVGAFRAQMVDCLDGKLLRINPVTGDGIPSNPFYQAGSPRSARSRVWAMGFRNPFRFTVRPNTGSNNILTGDIGEIYIGDVGWNTFEELNIVREGGSNFGWPIFEGLKYLNSYANASAFTSNKDEPNPLYGINGCIKQFFNFQDLIKQATADNIHTVFNPCNATLPISSGNDNRFFNNAPAIDWKHGADSARVKIFNGNILNIAQIGSPASGVTGTPFRGNCAIGGSWYNGSLFPVSYKDTYFQADLGGKWLKNITMKNAGEVESVRNFASGFNSIVCVTENPLDGSLFVVDLGAASIKKISYGGNQPPVIIMNEDQNFGPSPLLVPFQSSFSYDPEGLPLTYSWNFGDGSPISTEANPTHTFTTLTADPTPFVVTLTITDQQNATNTKSVIVSVNNTPPIVNITSPVKNSFYKIGPDSLYTMQATVTDAEHADNQLTYVWQTVLYHNNHVHAEPLITVKTGTTSISRIGCNGDDYHWQIRLTVTDAAGLSITDYADIYPQCISAPLPLVLKNFSVISDNESNHLLKWVTESEFNVSYFQLERSSDGASFKPLGKITALNIQKENEYKWLDMNPEKGYNYYRLKIVDQDGKFRYSQVIKINADKYSPELLTVSPNPFRNELLIKTSFATRRNISIRIIDINGRIVYTKNEVTVSGKNTFVLDKLGLIVPGMYTLELQDEYGSRRTKIMK